MARHGSLNRIYRLVWSELACAWIAVAETARGRGKGGKRKLVAALLSVTAVWAHANPTGGQVTAGSGTISQSGAVTTINQSSQNLSLNWSSFNVAAQETVNFVQPSASAVAVNRIFDTNGSQILGHLNANGQVYLINPNGVLFGEGAQVNVGGLVASTLDFNDATSNTGTRSFSGSGSGSVINQGTINANGGYVALLGNHVGNQGAISAQLGTVALGAGSAVTLTFSGNSLVHLQVDKSVLNSLAENGGLIKADGGQVIMTAGARDALLASVVNNTGVIEARTVENHNGTITLLGGMTDGTVNVGGTLDASAQQGNGGSIDTSAANVKVANGAVITTAAPAGTAGTWTIDPTDFTIAPSGGDITGAQLSTNLGSGNVTILSSSGSSGTSGNVNVDDTVTWSANKLTLNAQNNINFNSSITGSGTATLALLYGQGAVAAGNTSTYNFASGAQVNLEAGSNFSTLLGSNGTAVNYTVITSLGAQGSRTGTDLQGINGNLNGNYVLGANIDASPTSGWVGANPGFRTLGITGSASTIVSYTGVFDGLGHTVDSLYETLGNTFVGGLFASASSTSAIRNVGLTNISINGAVAPAGLASTNAGSISQSYVTGTISTGGAGLVWSNSGKINYSYASVNITKGGGAGLVGQNTLAGIINNSYATGNVAAGGANANTSGGLVATNYGDISNSYATGNVTNGTASPPTTSGTGGLVGLNLEGTITNTYATGNVSGVQYVGGLVGYNSAGTISNGHATGNATEISNTGNGIGGLVGYNGANSATDPASITNCYATGTVTGYGYQGGLVGINSGAGATINSSYSTGAILASAGPVSAIASEIGGLVGENISASVSNSYATGNISSTSHGYYYGGLVGYNSSAQVSDSYSTGSISTTFVSDRGGLIGTSTGSSSVTGSFWNTTTSGFTTSSGGTGMTTAQMQTQANFTSATSANGNVNPNWDFTGTWVMYNGQTYPLLQSFLTPLTVTANNASKTYDGTAYANPTGVTYSTPPNSNLLGTLSYTSAGVPVVNAGTYTILPGGLYSNQQGYIITYASGTLVVNPATLTVSGETANNKVYNGNTTAILTGGALGGVIGSDVVTLTQAGSFATKNAGTGIAVTASDSIGGASAGNYTLVQPIGLSANITPASLMVTGESAANKVYDGTTTATLSGGSLSGVIGGDTVSLTEAGNFATKNVGMGIAVTAGDSIGGSGASNYTLVQPTGLSANITPATLTVSGESAANKVYDGTTTATLTGGMLNGLVAGESSLVSLIEAGNFISPNVGTAIPVTASDSLSGSGAGNYILVQPTGLNANITPAP